MSVPALPNLEQTDSDSNPLNVCPSSLPKPGGPDSDSEPSESLYPNLERPDSDSNPLNVCPSSLPKPEDLTLTLPSECLSQLSTPNLRPDSDSNPLNVCPSSLPNLEDLICLPLTPPPNLRT
ncbi:hypothetical protein WMY93_027130 [Mugilogobius chulae]|uniref:Uncharacterized protein n=1 Tax=Mugilogobius chulae TaxID=88201 RepID=A0AAW0N3X6_9GOBI